MNMIAPSLRTIPLDGLQSTCPSIFQTEKHPSRSDKYTFISTMDQIKALMAEGFEVASARQARCRNTDNVPYTKHMVRLRTTGFGVGEVIPEVVLINAHNGGGASQCSGGALRVKCFNGLVVSVSCIATVHIPHRGDVLKEVIEGVMTVMSHARNIGRTCDAWGQIQLSPDDQFEFARRALFMRWAPTDEGLPSTAVQPRQLLAARRDEDLGDDLWRVFNRVQENVIQGGLDYTSIRKIDGVSRPRQMKSRPVRGIDQDLKLNQGLWSLAEEYALAA